VLLVGLTLVLVVVIVVGGALTWVTVRVWPQATGTIHIPGLDDEVRVVRDVHGIAHITAGTSHDLFLAQGFVHAQERMWQMEVWRHISAGRLSELFGPSQLDTDRFIRTLGWRRAAERDLAEMAPAARAVLEAYAIGVNAYLDRQAGSLGLAYLVAGAQPEPWTVLDSLAWQKVQAWNLGSNLDEEIFRFLLDARLGDPEQTDELFPPYPQGAPVITPTDALDRVRPAGLDTGLPRIRDVPDAPATPGATLTTGQASAVRSLSALGAGAMELAGLHPSGGLVGDRGVGSNEWVIAPELSATGSALLANDPHLGIAMPSVWIMNGLHCAPVSDACPYDVAGVSFPGTPAVVLGHNARIAWGATNLGADVQDLFVETVDPDDPTRYIIDGASHPFTTRTEEIRVAGAAPVVHEIRETIHGPILNDVDERLADAPLLALRWAATAAIDRTYEAILGVNTADDFETFRASLALYGTPSQNFVYADVDGHIGYQFPGHVPVRAGDPRGTRPRPGATGTHEWVGQVPFDELPWQLDPPDGWIVTANNAAVDADYPYHVATEWDPGHRAARIIDLIGKRAGSGLTQADMLEFQLDTMLERAGPAVSRLKDAAPRTALGETVLQMILTWDGTCDEASAGCAAYGAWEYRLSKAVFDDDLGELARDYVGSPVSWQVLSGLFLDSDAAWWDDVTTPEREAAPDIIDRALDEAGSELERALGDPTGWAWGQLHTATFSEATLGQSGIGPLEWYFNAATRPAPGAAGAINNGYYRFSRAYPDPTDPDYEPVGLDRVFEVTTLPSYRLTIDMGDLDGATIMTTTGQGGNPFGPHYGDLIEHWRTGESIPLPFTPAAIEAAAVATLTLRP